MEFVTRERIQQIVSRAMLLDEETEAVDGEWFLVEGMDMWTIDISGVSGDTLKVCASNDDAKPADSTHGRQLGSDITADGIFANIVPVTWAKLRVSAGGAGVITANFVGVTRKS